MSTALPWLATVDSTAFCFNVAFVVTEFDYVLGLFSGFIPAQELSDFYLTFMSRAIATNIECKLITGALPCCLLYLVHNAFLYKC